MNWFKHYTSDRNELAAKVIKKKFGAAGYGIYNSLLEVIGENVKSDNIEDWGHVDALHDVGTLADECACSIEQLREFLEFCNEKHIFEKHEGRLYCKHILERLDEYAVKVKQKSRRRSVGTKSRQNRDTKPTMSGSNRVDVGLKSGIEIEVEEEEKKKERESKLNITVSLNYLENIPASDLTDFLSRFELTEKQLKSKAEDLINYCRSHGKRYKNYRALLLNALKRDFKPKSQHETVAPPDVINPINKNQTAELVRKAHALIEKPVN